MIFGLVDQDGTVLDILVQSRRNKAAARRFLRRLLLKKTRTVPRVIITDKLRSYGTAHREVMPSVDHPSHKGLNTRAENSHRPLHNLGAAHRRRRPLHHGLSTQPEPDSTTAQHTVSPPHPTT
jgi:putative transposase